MRSVSELFALSSLLLLTTGLLSARFSALASPSVSIYSRSVSYAIPTETALFGVATLFGLCAFVYSVAHLNRSAALWHFWLSASAVMLLTIGFVLLGFLTKPEVGTSIGIAGTVAIIASFVGTLIFIGSQIVFLTNLIITILKAIHA